MACCVLDASAALAMVLADEVNPFNDDFLESLRLSGAAVPALWRLETANVLLVLQRRKRLSSQEKPILIAMLEHFVDCVDPAINEITRDTLVEMAERYHLSVYDAGYLELAVRMRLPLATCDQAIKKAALVHGIELVE